MHIYEMRRGDRLVLRPSGRLDNRYSRDLETRLLERIDGGETAVVIDFRDLEYISSAGLRVLLVAMKRLELVKGTLCLCALNDHVREVFEISGFFNIAPVHRTLEEALGDDPDG